MRNVRFLLVLALAALMDLGGGLPFEAAEAHEAFEEAAHGRRRLVRLARQADPPSAGRVRATTVVRQPGPGWQAPRARAASAPVRKVPAPLADPAAATEDH